MWSPCNYSKCLFKARVIIQSVCLKQSTKWDENVLGLSYFLRAISGCSFPRRNIYLNFEKTIFWIIYMMNYDSFNVYLSIDGWNKLMYAKFLSDLCGISSNRGSYITQKITFIDGVKTKNNVYFIISTTAKQVLIVNFIR